MNNPEQDLKRLAKEKALAQGYIFYGPDSVGAFKTAKSLAYLLEKGKWQSEDGTLSEVMIVDGTKQDLGVDVARQFSNFLYQFPAASDKRVLIVNGAADFTPQAQNAILKIAEEPPAHALIILIVKDLNVLLPAVLSRFQKMFFTGGAGEEELTEAQETARDLVRKFLAADPRGKSEVIKAMVTDEKDIEEKVAKVVDHFTRFLIEELSKKPELNYRALKHLLHRQQVMNDYSTNKRLQLESIIQFLP